MFGCVPAVGVVLCRNRFVGLWASDADNGTGGGGTPEDELTLDGAVGGGAAGDEDRRGAHVAPALTDLAQTEAHPHIR